VVTNPRKEGLEPIHVRVTNDNQPPSESHTPITSADIGKPLLITVKEDDPSGVKWIRLRYRGASQHQDYLTLAMLPMGEKGITKLKPPQALSGRNGILFTCLR